jgi:hypothetical protein
MGTDGSATNNDYDYLIGGEGTGRCGNPENEDPAQIISSLDMWSETIAFLTGHDGLGE